MSGVFNAIILALILLVAYWWSNQGFFSAILHCFCVIIAGALALAFWEPVVLGFLLKGNSFDNYAWGFALGLMFFLFLTILRVSSDLLVPFDIPFPPIVNAIGGGVFGFIAGIVTVGMVAISCGFIQGPTEIMGFIGWARHANAQGGPSSLNSMWIPAANVTENFYRQLSLGSLAPAGKGSPLAMYYPRLADTALSLHRDTFRNGDARVAIAPRDVTIGNFYFDPTFELDGHKPGAYAIEFTVTTGGFDNGEQFTLSSAQTKLTDTQRNPKVAFPLKFRQPQDGGEYRVFAFDDIGNYATSVPAEQDAKIVLIFPADSFPSDAPPSLFFLKGLRYRLAAPIEDDLAKIFAKDGNGEIVEQNEASPDGGFLLDASPFIAAINSIKPVQISTNNAGTMKFKTNDAGNFLSSGEGVYKKGSQFSISRTGQIRGFLHSAGTEVVMLDASRTTNGIDIWGDRSKTFKELGRDLPLEIVDSQGKGYKAVGWVWERQDEVEIRFSPSDPVKRIAALPSQPGSGEHKLRLVFIVPDKTEIVAIRIGKTAIARCQLTATQGRSD